MIPLDSLMDTFVICAIELCAKAEPVVLLVSLVGPKYSAVMAMAYMAELCQSAGHCANHIS
jgi:hypothetical protein